MGWAVGWESGTQRFRGYGVPAVCEDPECTEKIDRGLSYACGGLNGCGLFFCEDHLYYPDSLWAEAEDEFGEGSTEKQCKRCLAREAPYPVKPESQKWLRHVLTDSSWAQWRSEEPELVKRYAAELAEMEHSDG